VAIDDSRSWQFGGTHRVVACRGNGAHRNGFRGHVRIDRDFDVDELPHLIAFLVSVWDELYEPPF
jgi:hypothetical protein